MNINSCLAYFANLTHVTWAGFSRTDSQQWHEENPSQIIPQTFLFVPASSPGISSSPWVCCPCGIFILEPLGFLGPDIRPWFDIYPAGLCVLEFHLICIRAAYPSGKAQPRSRVQPGAVPGIRERCRGWMELGAEARLCFGEKSAPPGSGCV